MKKIIFYSWQRDLPNSTNRGLIQAALDAAVDKLITTDTVVVVDRDVQGLPGSPDIGLAILAKIAASDVVVVDVSLIGKTEAGRFTPNPNVLIELGYALRTVGHERLIMVFNDAYGRVEDLPFDLRSKFVLRYNIASDADAKAPERKKLQSMLESAIKAALEHVPEPEEGLASMSAIETKQPNKILILRRDLDLILKKLQKLEPKKFREGLTADEFLQAIDKTQEVVAEFSKLTEVSAVMNDLESALEVHRWFGKVFEQYGLPKGFNGTYHRGDMDFFKFLGHEMFVTAVAYWIREKRWETLDRVLDEPIHIAWEHHSHGPTNVEWNFASEHLVSLLDEGKKRQRASLQADVLQTRHTSGGLSAVLPFSEFVAADYFLFLRGELVPLEIPERGVFTWRPWSALYLEEVPKFIIDAEWTKEADRLRQAFKISTVSEFKKRLAARAPNLANLFRDVFRLLVTEASATERIGTR